MSIEKYRAFLESLDGEKGLPQDYRLLTPGVDTYKYGDEWLHGDFTWCAVSSASIGKLVDNNFNPVVRRAESRKIPDLKEKVKELMRDAMDAEYEYCADGFLPRSGADRCGFRALCAEVKP
ncbi:MAG: hypothetical protein IPJ01_12275 [Micavibrio sp.]|nr:hypothetical protein [Micavibrio sp.]